MEPMQEPMEDRRKHQPDPAEERHTAEERVAAGENFSCGRLHFRERTHAGQNHGGVGEGINPAHVFKNMIAGHADEQGPSDYREPKRGAAGDAMIKLAAGQERLGAVFEHGGISVGVC